MLISAYCTTHLINILPLLVHCTIVISYFVLTSNISNNRTWKPWEENILPCVQLRFCQTCVWAASVHFRSLCDAGRSDAVSDIESWFCISQFEIPKFSECTEEPRSRRWAITVGRNYRLVSCGLLVRQNIITVKAEVGSCLKEESLEIIW